MGRINLELDPEDLAPVIRRVVAETLAAVQAQQEKIGQAQKAKEPAALLWKSLQAARSLGISERKLAELTSSGEIPCVRIGRSVRYRPEDLEAWLTARKAHTNGKHHEQPGTAHAPVHGQGR